MGLSFHSKKPLAPERSVGGKERASDGPRNDPSGEKERCGRDWWCWPRNDPSGAKSVSGGTGGVYPRIILQGIGMVASVGGGGFAVCDTLVEGDAPSSPELTVGADGYAVDWNAPQGVTYAIYYDRDRKSVVVD